MEGNKRKTSRDKSITVVKRKTNKVGNYILGQTIGEGGFAKVKLATHIYTQQNVAIKLLDKRQIIKEQTDLIRIKKEINILKQLKHKNIIQLYEIMESNTVLYIVMEYCEGKELFDYIIKRKRVTEREACRFFQQIIDGVEYLHLQNITHRDLKPENLLLDSKKRIKISDFGLSTYSEEDELLQTSCGTPSYAPPEMLRGDEYNGRFSDIWSCGIILYTMLCGNLPCAESREDLIYDNLMAHEIDYPSYLSPLAIDLMNKLLAIDPLQRPDFSQIKQHPWFNMLESQLKPGLLIGVHKIPVDENILMKVEKYGYDKDKCRESIVNNRFDAFSCIYYLILKEFSKEGKNSVSDLCSESYVNFLRNVNNWLKPQEARKKKYNDYWPDDDGFELVLPKKLGKKVIKDKEKESNPVKENHPIKEMNNDKSKEEPKPMDYSMLTPLQIKTLSKKHHTNLFVEYNNERELNAAALKEKLLKVKQDNDNFLKSLNAIGNLGKSSQNPIALIANKLIKGTIFSKYLSSQSLIQDASELKGQFQLMQKYKSLIEIIETTHPGLLPRKLFDSNFSSCDTFLIEEEDFVFPSNFLQSKFNMDFMEKVKKSIQACHRKANSIQYHSERKPNNTSFSLPKEPNSNRKRRQILSISSYITDKQSEERSVSSLKNSAGSLDTPADTPAQSEKSNKNRTILQCKKGKKVAEPMSDCQSNESIKQKSPYKDSRNLKYIQPQLTTITKDSKKQKTRKDFFIDEFLIKAELKKRGQIETPKCRPLDFNRLQVKCLGGRTKEIHIGAFNQNVDSFNLLNLKNAFIHQFNRKAPQTTTHHKKKSLSFHQNSTNSSGKNISTATTDQNKSETEQTKLQELSSLIIYSGIVDIECCFHLSPSHLVKVIKDHFKGLGFFCIYTNHKFVCSRDKTMLEIALMKLLHTSLVYLKIKKIKGDCTMFSQIINDLLIVVKT